MTNAYKDENGVPTLIASSSADGKTPVRVYADPDTHRLLVNSTAGVVGPLTSTDNAIARFDGETGQTIQNSLATIDNDGNIDAVSYKAGGTSPIADGTYVVGSKITPVSGDDGTITVKGGIITAIQEAT